MENTTNIVEKVKKVKPIKFKSFEKISKMFLKQLVKYNEIFIKYNNFSNVDYTTLNLNFEYFMKRLVKNYKRNPFKKRSGFMFNFNSIVEDNNVIEYKIKYEFNKERTEIKFMLLSRTSDRFRRRRRLIVKIK